MDRRDPNSSYRLLASLDLRATEEEGERATLLPIYMFMLYYDFIILN